MLSRRSFFTRDTLTRPFKSRRSFFTRDTLTRPFKSRRTFNALNRSRVRVLVAEGPLSATSAASRQHKAHDWVDRYLFVPQRVATSASNGRRVQLARSLQHSILHSNPNEAPSKQLFVRVSPSDSQPPNLHPSNNHRRTPPQHSSSQPPPITTTHSPVQSTAPASSPVPLTGPVQPNAPNFRTINACATFRLDKLHKLPFVGYAIWRQGTPYQKRLIDALEGGSFWRRSAALRPGL